MLEKVRNCLICGKKMKYLFPFYFYGFKNPNAYWDRYECESCKKHWMELMERKVDKNGKFTEFR